MILMSLLLLSASSHTILSNIPELDTQHLLCSIARLLQIHGENCELPGTLHLHFWVT